MSVRIEQIGAATLILGDAREHLAELREAVCVLTDPPFGIGYQSGRPRSEDLWSESTIRGDGCTTVRDDVLAALAPRPTLAFGSHKAPEPPETRATLIWDKGPALGMGALDIPWKPSFEMIHVLGRGFVGARDEGSVIPHHPTQAMAKNGRRHPNEKPVGLLQRLLRKMPPGLVADPFMGSGSTAEAALLTGRPFIGCEIDERYFEIACARLRGDMVLSLPPVAAPTPADLFGSAA